MNSNPPAIDAAIDSLHAELERAETDARAVMDRIRRAGAGFICNGKRTYGQSPNPWASGSVNLTAQQTILRNDPALAHFLAQKAGASLQAESDARIAAERRKAESIARLQSETEQMRGRNAAHRQQQAREQLHGRWNSFQGKWL